MQAWEIVLNSFRARTVLYEMFTICAHLINHITVWLYTFFVIFADKIGLPCIVISFFLLSRRNINECINGHDYIIILYIINGCLSKYKTLKAEYKQ